jgi:hypothetical protein
MKDESKTKAQLFKAPEEQRQRNAELEKEEMEPKRAEKALRLKNVRVAFDRKTPARKSG